MGRRPLVPREPIAVVPTEGGIDFGKYVEQPEVEYVGGYLDNNTIKLLYRADGGQLRVRQHVARFASYHKFDEQEPRHVSALRQLRGSRHVLRVLDEGEWTRAEWRDYEARDKGIKWLESQGVNHWEADLSPVKRHFADTDDRTSATPRIAYLDIETDSRVRFSEKEDMRVVCWTVVDGCPEGGAVWWSGMLEQDSDKDEARVLEELWEALRPYDVVCAWYGGSDRPGEGFDFPVIRARSKRLGLGVDFRRWRWLDHLDVFKKMNAHVASTGDEKQSMSLQNICQSVLGEGKNDFDPARTWQEWEAGGESRARLLAYNQQDTMLLRKLEAKTGYLALFATICAASNIFVETKSLGIHQQTDGVMLRLGRQRGYHWPTKPQAKGDGAPWVTEKVKGAYVMEAPQRAGIIKGVHVLDFSGMYPSIMISWNMSPETLRQVADGRPVASCPLTHTTFYTDVEGIWTAALNNDRAMRKQWTAKKASLPPNTPEWEAAERWAMGYKVMANAKYGITLMAFGRYYEPRMGEGTTQNGAWLIKQTIEEGKKRGIVALYSDTDSCFTKADTEEQVTAFTGWCNGELYPKLVDKCGCKTNCIDIAYEKAYERIVFVASKKYCARLLHYKGKRATADSKPEIKGLEYKRGDAVKVARALQGECIDKLMRECCEQPSEFEPIVQRYLDHCLNDALTLDEVVLGKSLSKPIKDYAAETPPVHVRVAMLLEERGEDVSVGQKVMYVVTDYSPGEGGMTAIPAKDWTGEVDRYGLWEHLVWPPTQRLLDSAFPEHDWSRFEKVRPKEPPKPRTNKKGKEGQLTLLDADAGKVLRLVADETRGFNEQGVMAVKAILEMAAAGSTPVVLTVRVEKGDAQLEVGRKVNVDGALVRRLRSLLGDAGVQW